MSDPHEPVTVTDKRRIDPETGEVREASSGPAPSGPAPEGAEVGDTDEVADLKATLQRVKAEYDNYRKRALRQEQLAVERARAGVLTRLLPVLDDLDRARSHGDLESGPLKSVADKLADALDSLGLDAFGAEGDAFDPDLHEAVQHEGDGANPVLGTVMRQGYKFGDLVLRHAMVGVVDAVEDDTPDTADGDGSPGAQAPESE